jgi:hypothetical protein
MFRIVLVILIYHRYKDINLFFYHKQLCVTDILIMRVQFHIQMFYSFKNNVECCYIVL